MNYEHLSLTPETKRYIARMTGMSVGEISEMECDELDRKLSRDGKGIPITVYDSVLVKHVCNRYVSREEIDRRFGRI